MDDGKVKTFEGYRVQYNNARSVQGWSPVSSRYRNKRSESARLLDDTQVRCGGIPMGGGKVESRWSLRIYQKENWKDFRADGCGDLLMFWVLIRMCPRRM